MALKSIDYILLLIKTYCHITK